MDKVKLALIGAGERGQFNYAPYWKLHSHEMSFVAVAEPDRERRERFVREYRIPEEGVFERAEDFFAQPRDCDAVMICTQDTQHFEYACSAIRQGYKILLEKPISPDLGECLALQRLAEECQTEIMVCHVMRYTKFYRSIKKLLEEKAIGEAVSIVHTENVGYWHYAHSYVRGNWHKEKDASPMILAKCCHDMDILCWLLGSRCRSISSYGDLRFFTEANAPSGSPERCTDGCPASGKCPYYAPALYLSDDGKWPTAITSLGAGTDPEKRRKALEEGPYGKCVFHNDNDVVDHQVASMLFENGVTVAFTMCAFSNDCDRTITIMGTEGEIRASMDHNTIKVTRFGPGIKTGNTQVITVVPGGAGHSGGDEGIMEEFVAILKGERVNTNTISWSVHSHVMAFAAEESRRTGRTVLLKEFAERHSPTGAPDKREGL